MTEENPIDKRLLEITEKMSTMGNFIEQLKNKLTPDAKQDLADLIAITLAIIKALQQVLHDKDKELAEYEQFFDLFHKAEQRAINLWQQDTGRLHAQPDATALLIWLMGKIDAIEKNERGSSQHSGKPPRKN